jgi:hypothetical protein
VQHKHAQIVQTFPEMTNEASLSPSIFAEPPALLPSDDSELEWLGWLEGLRRHFFFVASESLPEELRRCLSFFLSLDLEAFEI